DITEQKELQTQLLKAEKLSAIGILSARLSHDLRNPLTTIKNTVFMLKTKIGNDAENIKRFEVIDRAIWRMALLIDDVLDFVKPKSLNLKSSSIRTIVETSIALMVIPSTVKINFDFPIKDAQLKCDPEKLEAVFTNLITNAIQAMNNVGQIYLRIKEEPENVIIEVEDTGPGIPDEFLPKIFDPLFTTKQVGTGLGLVTCKTIIEQHGGSIDVVQKPTTFIVRIPKNSR
ncbi:MAG: GHKL domain-containing protein, partial [Nitrosopumilales archaeon]|nr:GHKL domain-containing protein [Nitrosopumilales archaeon]